MSTQNTQIESETFVLLEENESYVEKLRKAQKTLESLREAQFIKMSRLAEAFRAECEFLVFYEDDPETPEKINGEKMLFFVQERFKKGKTNDYITDIFLNPGESCLKEDVYIFVYNRDKKEWLA
jgi:hypothetical protein